MNRLQFAINKSAVLYRHRRTSWNVIRNTANPTTPKSHQSRTILATREFTCTEVRNERKKSKFNNSVRVSLVHVTVARRCVNDRWNPDEVATIQSLFRQKSERRSPHIPRFRRHFPPLAENAAAACSKPRRGAELKFGTSFWQGRTTTTRKRIGTGEPEASRGGFSFMVTRSSRDTDEDHTTGRRTGR